MDSPEDIQQNKTITKQLRVPDAYMSSGVVSLHYNTDSQLIVLGGPRGPMLARYRGEEYPDPRRFAFLTTYEANYPVFRDPTPPEQAPADVCAIARPVEIDKDPRAGVASGATGDPIGGSGEGGPRRLITAESGYDRSMLDIAGLDLKSQRIDMHAASSGFSIDESGVHVEGGMEQPATQRKGVTKESPLFGLIPKTVITFFASDYLPNIQLILRLKRWVEIIRAMPTLYGSLRRIVGELGGDLPEAPEPDYDPEEAGEDLYNSVTNRG